MIAVHRPGVATLLIAVAMVGCGGGSLSLSEYSHEVDALLTKVDSRLDEHAAELFAAPLDVALTRVYLADRVAGYEELIDGLEAMDPPDQMADLHSSLRELTERLLAAEAARAAFAETIESVDDLDLVWDGPQARAVTASESEAIQLCYAAQKFVDGTDARDEFVDLPWIPLELKEVVRVAFDCPE